MNPIAEKIMLGEITCASVINIHNAQQLMDWVRDTDRHHTAETCNSSKPKDCTHAPKPIDTGWAATLVSESFVICTCGEHGTNNPTEAEAIIREFSQRWYG